MSYDANGSPVTEVVTNHDAGHIKFNADMESDDKRVDATRADTITPTFTHAEATQPLAPLVMADGTLFSDYLRTALPEDTPMDEWTKGYETCRRRLAAILLPQMEPTK